MRACLFGLGLPCLLILGGANGLAGVTRTYYIAADEVIWDYAPTGVNQITGKPFGEEENFWVKSGPHRIGKIYKKAIYREYTDETFTTLKPRPPQWEHLGMLGPLIRAHVGDTVKVVFKNNASFPASVHPHGVFYDKDSEGAVYEDGTSGKDKKDDGGQAVHRSSPWRPLEGRACPEECLNCLDFRLTARSLRPEQPVIRRVRAGRYRRPA